MRILKYSIALVLAIISLPSAARDAGDPWTAHYMWRRYYNTTAPCDTAKDKADYLCTGIIVRGTHPGEAKHVWWPEAKSLDPTTRSTGGVSFSYLRSDIKMEALAGPYVNGFTLYPQMGKYQAPAGKITLTVLCAFPKDGWTDRRNHQGCGETTAFPGVSASCTTHGITTAQQWLKAYPQLNGQRICGFDMSSQSYAAFKPVLDVMHSLSAKGWMPSDNELRIASWPANDATSKVMPIESFFYKAGVPAALKNAQNDQFEFYQTTGQFVPVIKMTYPTNASPYYDFSYNKSDQHPSVPVPKFPDKDPLPCDKNGGFDTKC